MQMTIENTYDNLKSSLDDLELMLHQMVRIDRARDVHELHDSIQNLLQAMGDYTKADRVFIFEFRDALHIYRNTYEWCAPGITPQIDNLQTIEPSDIPVWQAAFEQGENIVIPNLEDVRDTMPGEYEIMRIQDIHSEISFPIFSKDALIGFLGLDNPTIEGSHRFINLLAVVGSHLGGAWANFRTSALLEQSQSDLRDSMQALQKDQQVLEALCRDYTCVYTLDPVTDRIELVQVDPNANAQLVLAALQTRQLSHHEIIHAYYQNFVVKASARDFLTRLDGRALQEELNRKERVIYRFRALPNSAGQEYFELQAVKINNKNNPYRILVGFHHIDDIVNEELRQQKELETALQEITGAGYRILVAHIERYPCLAQHGLLARLHEQYRLRCQINCSAVLDSGFWQRMRLEHWVKAGLVDAISSDAHNCTSRPTRMRQAYERLCTRVGQTTAQKLTGLDGTEYLV